MEDFEGEEINEPLTLFVVKPRRRKGKTLPALRWKVKEKKLTRQQEDLLVQRLSKGRNEEPLLKPVPREANTRFNKAEVRNLIERLTVTHARCKTTTTAGSDVDNTTSRKKLRSGDISDLVKRLSQQKARTAAVKEETDKKVLEREEISALCDRLSKPRAIRLPPIEPSHCLRKMPSSEIEALSDRLASKGVKRRDSLDQKQRQEQAYWFPWTAGDRVYRIRTNTSPPK